MKNVRKFYDCSTGHLPQFTADCIETGLFPKRPAMTSDYGWLFSVPEHIEELEELGVTCQSFIKIMCLAHDAGCDYVLFDEAATPVEYLETFDW